MPSTRRLARALLVVALLVSGCATSGKRPPADRLERRVRVLEDEVYALPDPADAPSDDLRFPLLFTWSLPPLTNGPDLLVLATELAGVGGPNLPLDISAVDGFAAVTDAPERSLNVVARVELPLSRIYLGEDDLCDVLDRCHAVSDYLLDRATVWLGEDLL